MKVNVNPRHDIVQKATWKPTWQWQCRSLLRFHLGNLPMFCTWHLWTPHSPELPCYENRVRTPLLQQRVAHSWLTSASFNKANPWVQRVQGEWIDLTLDNDHDPCNVCRLMISTCYPPIIKHRGKSPMIFPWKYIDSSKQLQVSSNFAPFDVGGPVHGQCPAAAASGEHQGNLCRRPRGLVTPSRWTYTSVDW